LSMRDLRNERADQFEVQSRQLQSIVDTKRLRREGAVALETEEPLDGTAVASTGIATLEAPTAVAGRNGRTVVVRAARRFESHGSSFPRASPGVRCLPGGLELRAAVAGENEKNRTYDGG
jgi:hypothetical protein